MTPLSRCSGCHFIDLMSLAGMYASTAALLNVFDMQLDPGETHLLPFLE